MIYYHFSGNESDVKPIIDNGHVFIMTFNSQKYYL